MTTINIVTKETIDNEVMTILENAQDVGGKVYASIPIRLLTVDESYQRVEFTSEEKIADLARNFNPKLMDAPRVSAHVEEGKFYLVDGYHRTEAKKRNGDKSITCEILQDMSNDPEERRKQEADIFRQQQIWTAKLSPVAKHKANLICEDKNVVALDEIVKKYGLQYKTNQKRGRCPEKTLTGYNEALKVVENYNKGMLDRIFYVLVKAKWNQEANGLSKFSIAVLRNLFYYNPETLDNVDIVVKVLKNLTPRLFESKARAKYDRRGSNTAASLYIEDLVAAEIPLDMGFHTKKKVDTAA